MKRLFSRRVLTALSLFALPIAVAVAPLPHAPSRQASAYNPLSVADSDAEYTVCGRVFSDPLAYGPAPAPPAAPGISPFAKGNLPCRPTSHLKHDEVLSGLTYLESKFPDFLEVMNLEEDFGAILDDETGEGMTAGLPNSLGGRDKSPLHLIRVTDESVPEAAKEHFVFPLSIHGIERAGIEGGIRAVEDLVTWAATTPEQPVMETLPDSVPAGEVLKKSTVYFVLANPDGWKRGDEPNFFFQRYNGNGVDMNRDWPAIGFTFRPYTPWSEPETRSFGKVLKHIRPKWTGGIDLHGQLIDRAFSFTLLGASQRDYGKNQRVLQFTKGAWEDAEQRLSWHPLIKGNDEPESCVELGLDPETNDPETCDKQNRLYGVQWGTIWDTIDYTVTGAMGDWIDSPFGLDADGIDNEMSLSHLSNGGTGKLFEPSAEQLHVDGNKSLIYAMLNFALLPEDQKFEFQGKAAYLFYPARVTRGAAPAPNAGAPTGLPAQDDETAQVVVPQNGSATHEFTVKGTADGVYNGGLGAIATFTNVAGVGAGATFATFVERKVADEWVEVNKDFNQGNTYLQSGQKVDVNAPPAGDYRVRFEATAADAPITVNLTIDFTKALAWPDPGQVPYSVSNMDFFDELQKYVDPGKLTKVPVESVLNGQANLDAYDTVIVVDGAFAGGKALGDRLVAFAKQGGNVVLTDDAVKGLAPMGLVPAEVIEDTTVYAGYVMFEREVEGEIQVTYDDPLAANVDQPGAAEGDGHRHQVTEPVPVGYSIQGESGNDEGSMPQWGVDVADFEETGGRIVGLVGGGERDVTYGEIPLGQGRVRILGSFLPRPTQAYDHPYGLADYAITYTAYELAKNMWSHVNPNGTTPQPQPPPPPAPQPPPPAPQPPGPLPATGGDEPWLPLLLAVAAGAVAVRIRRLRAA